MGRLVPALVMLALVLVGVATWSARRGEAGAEPRAHGEAPEARLAPEPLVEAERDEQGRAQAPAREEPSTVSTSRDEAGTAGVPARKSDPMRGEIVGRVVTDDDSPVAEVLVLLESEGAGRSELAPLARTRTDARGRFSFAEVGRGPFRLEASGRWRGAVSSTTQGSVVPRNDEYVLVLRSCLVTGQVVDDRNRPVPRFQLEWSLRDAELAPREGRIRPARLEDGRFEASLSPGRWSYRASVPRSLVATSGEVEVPLVEPLVIVLPRAAWIEGRVLDGAGAPARGATVSACPPESRAAFAETRTRKDGSFRLELQARDALFLRAEGVRGEESASRSLSILPGETQTGFVLALPALARVTGQLVTPFGDPSGRIVQFAKGGVVSDRFPATRTDDGGHFALDVPPGNLVVLLELGESDLAFLKERGSRSSRSTLSRKVELQPGDVRHLEFRVDSPVRLLGEVTLDGRPAESGQVQVFSHSTGIRAEIAPIRAGHFELTLLTAGSCELLLRGDAWGVARVRLDVPPVAEFRHDVMLESGAIVGIVRDAAGSPVAGLTVDAMASEGDAGGDGRAVTDASGTYRMVVVAGNYRVFPRVDFDELRSFREPAAQHTEVAAGKEARADFRLDAATIAGIVRRADGGALEGGAVTLEGEQDTAQSSFGPDGRFHLTFEGARAKLSAFGVFGEERFTTEDRVVLEFAPDRTRTLEVLLSRACLVRARLPGGENALFSRVEALDEHGHGHAFEPDRSLPSAEDRVHTALLFPGMYRLRAHDGPVHERSVEPCASMAVRELVVNPLERVLEVEIRFE